MRAALDRTSVRAMSIGNTFGNPKHCKDTADRIAAQALGTDSGLNREEALEILQELDLTRSKLSLAEHQFEDARQRLEDAGLIPKR